MKMLVAAALIGSVCFAAPAFAEPQVDQINLVPQDDLAVPYDINFGLYQSFTAGLTGALVSVGFQLSYPSVEQLDVGIYTFDDVARAPGQRLGTASFSRVNLPGTMAEIWFFSTDLFVVAGQQYAIQLVAESDKSFWRAAIGEFSGGQAGKAGRPMCCVSFGFVTNVDTDLVPPPAAIPEPATWAMMISGFGLIGGALRRRRHGVTNISFDIPG